MGNSLLNPWHALKTSFRGMGKRGWDQLGCALVAGRCLRKECYYYVTIPSAVVRFGIQDPVEKSIRTVKINGSVGTLPFFGTPKI